MRIQVSAAISSEPGTAKVDRSEALRSRLDALSQVFESKSVAEIYDQTASSLAKDFVRGRNVCFAVLGIAGSGQIQTLLGNQSVRAAIAPLAFVSIFDSLDKMAETQAHFSCQLQMRCLQVYDEKVLDLLSSKTRPTPLRVEHSAARGYHVPAASDVIVRSARAATALLHQAMKSLQGNPASAIIVELDLKWVSAMVYCWLRISKIYCANHHQRATTQ